MSLLEVYGIGLIVALVMMTLLWLLSLWLKNSCIADIYWGTGFIIAHWVYFVLTPDGYLPRVPGVALLEKTLETRRGYKVYVKRTSAFVPWFPQKRS